MFKSHSTGENYMKRNRVLGLVFTLLISSVSIFAQNVTIDYRMNINTADPAENYLKWSFGNLNISDALDVTTGASKMKSTPQFDAVRYDSAATRNMAIPEGLRSLLMFPLAPRNIADDDNLQVEANGKQVIIRYVHRGSAHEFRTDANGKLDILTGCKVSAGIAYNNNNVFVLRSNYLKAGADPLKMTSIDWTKLRLITDTFGHSASRHYEGVLDVAYADGILTMKGTLVEKK
jgi:hypothetical protein